MMLPPSNGNPNQPMHATKLSDESLTEDYGEGPSDRSLVGGADFFSSIGIERKKKLDTRPDPEKVSLMLTAFILVFIFI